MITQADIGKRVKILRGQGREPFAGVLEGPMRNLLTGWWYVRLDGGQLERSHQDNIVLQSANAESSGELKA